MASGSSTLETCLIAQRLPESGDTDSKIINRPLFPVTCGDIGETAKEVEHNLEQNFSLAHRWGCVLLVGHICSTTLYLCFYFTAMNIEVNVHHS